MADCKIKREQYITIQGFMLTDLHLKGNELLVYACIYGFSQAENQVFNGSLRYLAEWTNSTKQGVIKCLKSLEEKQYIGKKEKYINGVKYCEYYATEFNTLLNKVEWGSQQSLTGGSQQSLPNNKPNDNLFEKIKEIIGYMNRKIGANYRYETNSTKKHITARLKEGYTVEDFKTVIDKKTAEWKGTELEKYLRPETLFGTKFENYLNAKAGKQAQKDNVAEWLARDYEWAKEIEDEAERTNASIDAD
jgi:uncharacterized phage protein (TIGR02220 family)